MASNEDEEEAWFDAEESQQEEEQQQGGHNQYESVYELHKAAYNNDTAHLSQLLQRMPAEQHTALDLHGNTALHVAAMRGNTAAVEVLLAAGLPAKIRSSRGWTPLEEACAARSMPTAKVLQARLLSDAKAEMKAKRSQLLDSMQQMPDYSLQLKWQLGSSVPGLGLLLRKYAPHDTYTIWKVGNRLRVDGSLMGIDTKSSMIPEWKRGHFSLIVDGSPQGIAAAAAAAEDAVAEARAAAQLKQQQRQQRWGQQPLSQSELLEQEEGSGGAAGAPPAPTTPAGSSVGDDGGAGAGAAGAAADGSASGAQSQQQQQQQEFFDPQEPQQQGGGPRLLFLNHTKGSWVDLSADRKALKLEGAAAAAAGGAGSSRAEQEEAMAELQAAMDHDMERLRVKPRNFKFAPVRGWLGGDATEKVEGWKCTVYEAAGKLVAVSTNKGRLQLSPSSTFEDYLAAVYSADRVSETLLDPLTPSGLDIMSSGKKDKSYKSGSAYGVGGGDIGSSSSGVNGVDEELEGMMGGAEPPQPPSAGAGRSGASSSSSSSKKGASGSSSSSKDASAAADGTTSSSSGSGGRVLRARCWMAEGFPMSMGQLLPLLDVIGSTTNKHMGKVGKFLATYSSIELFPVKLQVPLLLTVYAVVCFKAFHLLTPTTATSSSSSKPSHSQLPSEDFFAVPAGYRRRKLQDVMEKSAKNTFGDLCGAGAGGGWGQDEDEDDEYGDFDYVWPGAAQEEESGAGSRSSQQRRRPPAVFYGGDPGAEYQ